MAEMKRRDILKLSASMAAIPAAGLAQNSSPVKTPPPSAWNPAFFNAHQLDTITDFSDLIIPTTDTPGAKDALVSRYLDKVLAASDQQVQNEFARDLDTLDRFARTTAGAELKRLTPDQQKSVLEKMSLSDQRPAFDRLKIWTARIYYSTKPGYDELNNGGRVPSSFGCKPA